MSFFLSTSENSAEASSTLSSAPIAKALPRPHILIAATGSVASLKFSVLAQGLSSWADVKAICTKSAIHFIDKSGIPASVTLYTDDDEWNTWKKLGDSVLHIELRKWADIMIIAPLSANSMAKIAGGFCDNLVTCVVRAWDFSKPLMVAPAMNTLMWQNPFTERHISSLESLGVCIILPVSKKLACGDVGTGAMAELPTIEAMIKLKLSSLQEYAT